jgi:hypothetical protein
LDRVPNSDIYEIHVYKRSEDLDDAVSNRDAKSLRKQEVGVVGPDGNWIKKHGHTQPPVLTTTADNKLRSRLAQEARLRGWLPPKGQADIKGDKLGAQIRSGMSRTGALKYLVGLGKSLGSATVVLGYLENLSTEKAETLQPGFLESLNE